MTKQCNLLANRLFLSMVLLLSTTSVWAADQKLSLSEYLNQVTAKSQNYKSAQESRIGGLETRADSHLLLAPSLYFNSQYKYDKSLPLSPGISYDYQEMFTNSVGVRKLTTFGLQADAGYEYDALKQSNLTFSGFNQGDFNTYQGRPMISLTQSLWANGFGRATQATIDQIDAQSLQKSRLGQYQAEALVANAESTYWQLASARRQIEVLTQSVNQARRILEWNQRRRQQELNETVDVLQAQAAVEQRNLDLQTQIDSERELSQQFNSYRFVQGSEVPEALDDMPDIQINKIKVPTRAKVRADVLAAEQAARLAKAGAVLSEDRYKPQLDVYGMYALSGQDNSSASKALGRYDKPTTTVGVKFVMPLDFESLKQVRSGYAHEQAAAEANYQQKQFEETRDWQNLSQKLTEAQRRYELADRIEEIQRSKMLNERQRFNSGRTTTYEVLLFEQDYLLSRLAKLRAQYEVLSIVSQMKLWDNPT